MNEQNRKNLTKKMKEATARCKVDKEYARQLLQATGMYTPTGRLKKRFR